MTGVVVVGCNRGPCIGTIGLIDSAKIWARSMPARSICGRIIRCCGATVWCRNFGKKGRPDSTWRDWGSIPSGSYWLSTVSQRRPGPSNLGGDRPQFLRMQANIWNWPFSRMGSGPIFSPRIDGPSRSAIITIYWKSPPPPMGE